MGWRRAPFWDRCWLPLTQTVAPVNWRPIGVRNSTRVKLRLAYAMRSLTRVEFEKKIKKITQIILRFRKIIFNFKVNLVAFWNSFRDSRGAADIWPSSGPTRAAPAGDVFPAAAAIFHAGRLTRADWGCLPPRGSNQILTGTCPADNADPRQDTWLSRCRLLPPISPRQQLIPPRGWWRITEWTDNV